jgi:competence transcription factor ComK
MIVQKYIAFQTVDKKGDIWCNKAFLFKTIEEAEIFFSNVENIMAALDYSLEENEDGIMETIDTIQSSLKMLRVSGSNKFFGCEFTCHYAGTTKILQMSKGVVISEVTV